MPAIRNKSSTLAVGDAYKTLATPFELPYPAANSYPSSPSSCASSVGPATPIDSPSRKPVTEEVARSISQKFIDKYHARARTPSPDGMNTVTRPPNAFIIFRSWWLNIMPPTAERRQNEHSKSAGQQWATMGSDEREPWQNEARRVDEEHQIIFPDYKYAPSRRKSPKTPRKRRPASPSRKVDSEDEDDAIARCEREAGMNTEVTNSMGMAMDGRAPYPWHVHGAASIANPPETPQKPKALPTPRMTIPSVAFKGYGLTSGSTARAYRAEPTSPVLSISKKSHPHLDASLPILQASPGITVEQPPFPAGSHPATSDSVSQFGQPDCWGNLPPVTTDTLTADPVGAFAYHGVHPLLRPDGPPLFVYNHHDVLPDSEKFLNSYPSNVSSTLGEMMAIDAPTNPPTDLLSSLFAKYTHDSMIPPEPVDFPFTVPTNFPLDANGLNLDPTDMNITLPFDEFENCDLARLPTDDFCGVSNAEFPEIEFDRAMAGVL